MSQRLIMVVDQPCILCEETLEIWNVFKDEESGTEWHEVETRYHRCAPLRALITERFLTARPPSS